MAPPKRRKLYFDVAFGATQLTAYFPCTQFTAGVAGDRYGCLLDALEALTGGSPLAEQAKRAVTAWFQPSGSTSANLNLTSRGFPVALDFVQPTLNVANDANVSRLRFLAPGGTPNAQKAGQDSIFGTVGSLRHFSIRLLRANNGSGVTSSQSLRGVLYVQRQHTMEV